MVTDIIGQPINVGDFVAYYSNVYEVLGVTKNPRNGAGSVKVILVDRSKTTRAVTKYSKEMAVLNKEHVITWIEGLKK